MIEMTRMKHTSLLPYALQLSQPKSGRRRKWNRKSSRRKEREENRCRSGRRNNKSVRSRRTRIEKGKRKRKGDRNKNNNELFRLPTHLSRIDSQRIVALFRHSALFCFPIVILIDRRGRRVVRINYLCHPFFLEPRPPCAILFPDFAPYFHSNFS